jgi:hypothetical protein
MALGMLGMKVPMNTLFRKLYSALMALLGAGAAMASSYTFTDGDLQDINGHFAYRYLTANPGWSQTSTYNNSWTLPGWSNDLCVTSIVTDFWFADDNDADTQFVKSGCYRTVTECVWNFRKRCWEYKTRTYWDGNGGSTTEVVIANNLEKVNIDVGGVQIQTNLEVDGAISYIPGYLGNYDDVNNPFSTVNDPSTFAALVAALVTGNGTLNYKVKATFGDTYLKETRITVNAEDCPPPPPVPDSGATLVLLGAALVGAATVCRKR